MPKILAQKIPAQCDSSVRIAVEPPGFRAMIAELH